MSDGRCNETENDDSFKDPSNWDQLCLPRQKKSPRFLLRDESHFLNHHIALFIERLASLPLQLHTSLVSILSIKPTIFFLIGVSIS
jgi:hypothetical protein